MGSNEARAATEALEEFEAGRKGEILAAAAEVFVERGYDAGSMRDIAARVGVSEPAIYRHFPGKEALFLALVRAVATRVTHQGTSLIDEVSADTLRDQIVAAFVDRRRAIRYYAPLLRTIAGSAAHNQRFLEEYRHLIIEPVRAHVLVKAAEIDRELGVRDAETTRDARVRALMALFVGFFVSSFVLADEPEEAMADAVLRVMQWDVGLADVSRA